eukprot:7391848-Prymnesium_polylepis.3
MTTPYATLRAFSPGSFARAALDARGKLACVIVTLPARLDPLCASSGSSSGSSDRGAERPMMV